MVDVSTLSMADETAPDNILRQVDQMRFPKGGFEASIIVTPIKDGQPQEPGHYIVRSNGSNQALVEAMSSDQLGQKFLTTDSGIFFYAPRTKRAIRLTPLQTLRGQASVGDISRLHFSLDYEIEASSAKADCGGKICIELTLISKNEGSTYTRINLTVRRHASGYEPIRAELFVASGKLMKIVEFSPSQPGMPALARYIDAVNLRLQTTVVYETIRSAQFPSNMFNPRALEQ